MQLENVDGAIYKIVKWTKYIVQTSMCVEIGFKTKKEKFKTFQPNEELKRKCFDNIVSEYNAKVFRLFIQRKYRFVVVKKD